MANINESTAEESALKGKPRRKLHFIVTAIVSVALAGAVMYTTANRHKKKDAVEVEQTAPVNTGAEKFASQLKEQANPDLSGLGKPTPVDPNNMFPSEADINSATKGQGNVNGKSKSATAGDAQPPQLSEKEAELQRLKDEGASSKLMVLTSSKNTLGISNARLQEELRVPNQPETSGLVLSDADKALLAAASSPTQSPTSSPTQRQSDLVWYDAQRNQSTDKEISVISKVHQAKKYTIFEGSEIPAITTKAISSDLPGQATAMVRENVYDGIDGKTVLIPKGSKVVGAYNNDVSVGQKIVQTAFNRIIFPNGQSITIGGMPGAGVSGQAGLKDKVDTHFWEIFGSSFLIAGVSALVDNSNRGSTVIVGGSSTGDAVSGAAGSVLSSTSRTILQRNVNILPTIEITPGLPFNITVTKDISIAPYMDNRP
jgi:type IV secretion system protein VirB10